MERGLLPVLVASRNQAEDSSSVRADQEPQPAALCARTWMYQSFHVQVERRVRLAAGSSGLSRASDRPTPQAPAVLLYSRRR